MKEIWMIVLMLLGSVLGYFFGVYKTRKEMKKEIMKWKNNSDKHLKLFQFSAEWVRLLQNKKTVVSFFEQNQFKKVAVYGASYLGQCLVNELEQNGIEVAYVIDKKAKDIFCGKTVRSPQQIADDVDAFIVTAITFFDEIEEELLKKTDMPIISLKEIMGDIK